MRKLLLSAGLVAMAGAFVIACSDFEPTSPPDPQFGKKATNCDLGDLQNLADEIREEIDDLFSAKKKSKAAHEIFNNIDRKVCSDQFSDALNMALGFYEMTYDQLPDKLNGDAADAAYLVNLVFQFAGSDPGGSPPPVIPPGALEPTGGIGIIYPGTNDTIWTNNDEAAFVGNAGSFSGSDPVTVVLVRLPDPVGFGFPIPGFQAYPEAYDFFASADLVGDAEFWMCVVTDPPEPPFDQLVIGHDLGEGAELLTPRLLEDFPGQVLDCGNAVRQPQGPVVGASDAPGWLRFAGEVLRPVANRLLGVKPLQAMFFAGKGLGGRGTSFSAFAPVDGGVPHPVLEFVRAELDVPVGEAEAFDYYYIGVDNWEDYPDTMFENSGDYPCGQNPIASRTQVEIFDAADGTRIYGFCGFDSADDLTEFWFVTDVGDPPPDVYIELWDQDTDTRYRSNTIVIPPQATSYTLTIDITGPGQVVDPDGVNIDCREPPGEVANVCSAVFPADTQVELYGFSTVSGYIPSNWSNCSPGIEFGECIATMDADKTVSVEFIIFN